MYGILNDLRDVFMFHIGICLTILEYITYITLKYAENENLKP